MILKKKTSNFIKIHLYSGMWSSTIGFECVLHTVTFSVQSKLRLSCSIWCSVAVQRGQPSRSTVIEFSSTKWFPPITMWSANDREKYSERNWYRACLILIKQFWNFCGSIIILQSLKAMNFSGANENNYIS